MKYDLLQSQNQLSIKEARDAYIYKRLAEPCSFIHVIVDSVEMLG